VTALLDTHAFLWWLVDDRRLTERARSAISDPAATLLVSAATAWEIGLKVALGRLRIPVPPDRMLHVIADEGFEPLAIEWQHAIAAAALPSVHRDPFDRLLVAQAQILAVPIITRDADIARYDVDVLW
jgi:PIN domain nuclease of toxin-antitoxin system